VIGNDLFLIETQRELGIKQVHAGFKLHISSKPDRGLNKHTARSGLK
jgi:hypothetical protein